MRLNLPEVLMPYAEGGFRTDDGKAALYSGQLEAEGHGGLAGLPSLARRSDRARPRAQFPLMLMTPKNHVRFLNSSYSHHHGEKEDGPYFEIDPADASDRGIGEGDHVRVWNERAELTLRAKLSDRLRPGLALIPWGWWMDAAHANALTNDTLTDWGGGVAYSDTLVEAAKAD